MAWVLFAALFGLAAILFFSAIRASLFSEVDEGKRIWFDLLFLLFAAIIAEFLVLYLRQPSVMALMLLGAAISPSFVLVAWPIFSGTANYAISELGALPFLGQFLSSLALPSSLPHLVAPEGTVEVLAQLGALILLFKVGLQSNTEEIFNKKNFLVAFAGVILPFFAGYAYASFSGHSFAYAMFLGAALTATSVGVTVAILSEFRLIKEEFAKILMGAAVIDDILGLLVLSIVVNFPKEASAEALLPLGGVFFSAIIFLAGGIILGRFLVRKFIDVQVTGAFLPKKTFLSVMAFFLLYAYVAEFIGLSGIVGAFLAGLILNYSKFARKIEESILPLELLFVPMFFISLGMLVDVSGIIEFAIPILIISAIAVITKLIGCGSASLLCGLKKIDSALVGVGMSPRGEIALIIALLGLSAGVLTQKEYTIIASMAFLTTIITPPMIKWLLKKRTK